MTGRVRRASDNVTRGPFDITEADRAIDAGKATTMLGLKLEEHGMKFSNPEMVRMGKNARSVGEGAYKAGDDAAQAVTRANSRISALNAAEKVAATVAEEAVVTAALQVAVNAAKLAVKVGRKVDSKIKKIERKLNLP